MRILILKTISFLVLLTILFSCCKSQHEQGSLQPEWETEIPTFESNGIYDDGLPNLPKYEDLIVAHTSIYHGSLFEVDSRLCAIDVSTGDAKWYFPSDFKERRYGYFKGDDGYLYKNKLLFQYEKDASSLATWDYRATTCLDVKTGTVLWEKDSETNRTSARMTVVGRDETAFYVQDSMKVVKVNLNDDTFSDFFVSDSLSIGDLYIHDGYLTLFCWRSCEDHSAYDYSYIVVLDSESGKEILPATFLCRIYMLPRGIISDDVLYASSDGYLTAISIKTGEKLWERNDYWAHSLMDMFVYKDVLLKCGENATVGYDKNTGEILYDYRNYGSYFTSVNGKYAYLINRQQNVDIINIETGEKLDYIKCKYQEQGEDFSGSYPAIYGNKMYIMSHHHLFRYPLYPW